MAIVAKNKATIVAKYATHYDPATFSEFVMPNFIEATAEEVLAKIKPMTFDFLPGEKFIAVDTETFYTGVPNNQLPSDVVRRWIKTASNKHIPNDFPFCISISDGTNSFAVYDTLKNMFAEFRKLMPLLTDTSISKIGHNLDYDLHMCANTKTDIKGRIHDTMYLSKLTRADAFTHNLCDIADEIYNANQSSQLYAPTVTRFEHMLDSYKAQYKITDYRQFPKELMVQYTCADTWNALWSFKILYPRLIANEQLKIYDIECQMMLIAYRMERNGILLDPEYQYKLIPELQKEVEEAEKRIYAVAGRVFNINSSQQLESVLISLGYGDLITYNAPTEAMLAKGIVKGNACFDKNEKARLDNEGVTVIADILEYQNAEKLLNTFAIKLFEMCDYYNYVHCNINTIEAKTGRFSISDPSMQNMPRRKDDRVRGAFVAPEGYTMYDGDFKSQEMVVLAHYSRCAALLNMIKEGHDIHKATASIVYSMPIENVTKVERDDAKSVGFAVCYGAGPSKVASMTKKTKDEASVIMKTYMKKLPEVDMFIKTTNRVVKERGMVRTILNRHVYAEHGREYACVNYVIQGSSADSTKSAMVRLYRYLRGNGYKTKPVLQVHDSLLYYVANDERDIVLPKLRWLQIDRELFRVPVSVDFAICNPTWKDKVDIEVAAIEPTAEEMQRSNDYDIWSEGILTA